MLEGLIRFSPDLVALIKYDEEDEKTEKAVYIDAEGNETPICGGGSSDFEVFTVTINAAEDYEQYFYVTRSYYDGIDQAVIPTGREGEYYMIAYNGEIQLTTSGFAYSDITGAAELSEGWLVITGDCTFSLSAVIH